MCKVLLNRAQELLRIGKAFNYYLVLTPAHSRRSYVEFSGLDNLSDC